MDWIIRDGLIEFPEGDGIRIEGPTGRVEITGMTIRGAKGSGIYISGADPSGGESNAPVIRRGMPVVELTQLLRSNIRELDPDDRKAALTILDQVEQDPSTEGARKGLRLLYDMAVSVSGSVIASILQTLVR